MNWEAPDWDIIVLLVREAEVILPTFSRGKSILLLNCPLDA